MTEDHLKAEILNDFFISVLVHEPEDLQLPTFRCDNIKSSLFDVHISEDEVRSKLLKLKPNKSSGPDNIHVYVLRNVPNLSIPLTKIFQLSMNTGVVPQDWRDAHVTPLHKKGSRTKCNNYRPVSLTSQICKLMERLIFDSLWQHVKQNNIIHCSQHGFQKNCSCVTQLIECLNDWIADYDKGLQTDVIYLDFCKAFASQTTAS